MAKYHVVDADGHVREPVDMWPKYLEPRYHYDAPRFVTDNRGITRSHFGGRLQPYIAANRTRTAAPHGVAGGADSVARLKDMDAEGIKVAVLFPTIALGFAAIPQADTCTALCRAYNNWIVEYRSAAPERLFGIAAVPQMDVYSAVIEAKRAVTSLGCKGIFLRPNPIAGRTLDDPYFDPLWSLLEELDVPVCIHEGTAHDVPQAGRDRYDNFLFRHVVSHPHEQQMACLELICGGVLERHPKLTVAFLEAGVGWIAHWIERLDHHMKYWDHTSLPLPSLPSEYFVRQCFISTDPDEKILPGIVSTMGDDNIVFASDYPHPDAVFPGVVAELADRNDVSEQTKRKILGLNAVRLFRLPLTSIAKNTPRAQRQTPLTAAASPLLSGKPKATSW